jgi:hypothetical protein
MWSMNLSQGGLAVRTGKWLGLLALVCIGSGCCSHPGVFQQLEHAMQTVQSFYDPLIKETAGDNDRIKLAVVAADTTLLLAAELQNQWCPDPDQARQVELQAQNSQKLAREAGVIAAAAGADTSGN